MPGAGSPGFRVSYRTGFDPAVNRGLQRTTWTLTQPTPAGVQDRKPVARDAKNTGVLSTDTCIAAG